MKFYELNEVSVVTTFKRCDWTEFSVCYLVDGYGDYMVVESRKIIELENMPQSKKLDGLMVEIEKLTKEKETIIEKMKEDAITSLVQTMKVNAFFWKVSSENTGLLLALTDKLASLILKKP